jgi:hypothetical protein
MLFLSAGRHGKIQQLCENLRSVTEAFQTFKAKMSTKRCGATFYDWNKISVRHTVYGLAGLVLPADRVFGTPYLL